MARRKKYPKLPNGYGTIRWLGKNRRNPYAVHPPSTEVGEDGRPIMAKALCYVDDYMKGFAVLTAYKAGKYYPGYEKTLDKAYNASDANLMQSILADYNLTKAADEKLEEKKKTFSEVYNEFYEWKFERPNSKKFSQSTKNSTIAAFKNCSAIHQKAFADLRHNDLQNIVDDCPLKHASKELIVSLFHQMYAYADLFGLAEKDYSSHVKINTIDDDEHGVAFTEDELCVLWANKDNDIVAMILIMCYSGYRIAAYKNIEINLDEKYFRGGVKTVAGKDRIVPIHSGILDLVKKRIRKHKTLMPNDIQTFRSMMYAELKKLHIDKHTPHDCRHTFSALCEKYGVNENDRKRMLGHAFDDITNKVYGHRSVEDLREEIEKIKICDKRVTNR